MKILDSFSAPFSPAVLLSQTTHPSFLCFQGFISERPEGDSSPGILKDFGNFVSGLRIFFLFGKPSSDK